MHSVTHARSSRLPPEILEHIFLCNFSYEVPGADIHAHENPHSWRANVKSILPCCGVSRDWYCVASGLLYRQRIDIRSVKAMKLLLRTVKEFKTRRESCPIRHLSVCNYAILHSSTFRQELNELTTVLLAHCTELQCLECRFISLLQSPNTPSPFPIFSSLRELSIGDVHLGDIAPLLICAPALKRLDASMLGNPLFPSPSDALDALLSVPPPAFSLRDLRVANCRLSQAQARWLLANSRDIAQVDLLAGQYGMLAPLSCTIGRTVHSLYIRDFPQDSVGVAHDISRFTRLTALRLGHYDWSWSELLSAITAPLEWLELPYSKVALTYLTTALSDRTWLQSLGKVVIYHLGNTDRLHQVNSADVKANRKMLKEVCYIRGIECSWVEEKVSGRDVGVVCLSKCGIVRA
ncbi:hypothetical protein SCP_0214390 [Sparassis crispa]|uniref:Uncharacterized protein n=1 Tax=Sparassis crispa TaxID=139825 RepID=A0A401GDG6_9APHY|nr:hypothetical protein SCP_0214390 [Sparassis crispa]GBE80229.1 hypothetical protein SCP_0214390 [Sparassis crispa]